MPDPKLSVLVRVDLDGRHLRLIVTGCLTVANQQGLHPVIERARTLTPTSAVEVLVDLTAADLSEPAAVEVLRAGIEQQCRDRPGGTVGLVLPGRAATTDHTLRAEEVVPSGAGPAADAGRDSW